MKQGLRSVFFFLCFTLHFSVWGQENPAQNASSSVFTLPSGVRVEIVESSFEKGKFEVSGCVQDDGPCRINGHVPFGTAFGLPKTYVKAITASYRGQSYSLDASYMSDASYRGQSYSLDASDMYDAWGSRPLEVKGAIRYFGGQCSDAKNCEFRGIFSDGAGTFVAEWSVVNGMSVRNVLTDSSDVVDLFMRHIDPPDITE